MRFLTHLFLGLFCCQFAGAAEQFGTIDTLHGDAYVTDDAGVSASLVPGQKIYEGQTLGTRADGEVHVVTVDGGFLALRPNSQLRVDTYKAEKSAEDKVYLSLLKGALRAITGWIGKGRSDAYRTKTPTATIGIRGTDHETMVLLERDNHDEPGTYQTVYDGVTFLGSPHGEVEVRAGQFAFASRDRAAVPTLIGDPPDFYRKRQLNIEHRIQQRKEALAGIQDRIGEERMDKLREMFSEATPEQREVIKRKVVRTLRNRRD